MRYFNQIKQFLCATTIGLALIGLSSATFAEDISVSAEVNRNNISLNDRLVYEIKITGGQFSSVAEPEISDMFDISSRSQSQQFSWINGTMSSYVIKKYTLVPIKTGSYVIPPAKVKSGKKTIKSNAVEVTVTSANTTSIPSHSSQPSTVKKSSVKKARGNVFIQGFLNKTSAYVGEQITYTLKLFRHTQFIENVQFRTPKFDGFWVEELGSSDKHAIESIQGRRYYIFELEKKALFGLKPGKTVIDPAKAGYDIIGFFGQSRVIESPPLTIDIKPLPEEGKPEDFGGLVGDFNLTATLNSTTATNGSPLNLSINLTGMGNIKSIHDMNVIAPPGLKIYQSDTNDNVTSNQTIKGNRIFEYIIVPKASGTFEIPPISLSFFSPTLETYQTIQTEPLVLTVSGVGNKQDGQQSKSEITQLNQDIHYIKSHDALSGSKPVYKTWWFLLLLMLNLGLLLMEIGVGLKHLLFKQSAADKIKQKAKVKAFEKLNQVPKDADVKSRVSQFQNALLEYLSHKTGESFLGLTETSMQESLERMNVPSATIQRMLDAMEALSLAAFAPTSQSPESISQLKKQVEQVIEIFDQEISS